MAGLSKKFRRYASVAEGIKEALHPLRKRYHREFWALRDVSFEVRRGESVGIVGRNGSGKSTLLQVICGILQPTTGSVEVAGKVAALLELGAGFHPEFTGRENVFLQGAIMGFTKEETEARFEEVASFADIGDFIEQPVRTYSSGMLVRLAFASAVSVEPDILVVDEALSVGDMRFQQKCYRKINDFKEMGGTIILITHDMSAVRNFCSTAAWLRDGVISELGNPVEVVKDYISHMTYDVVSTVDRPGGADKEDEGPVAEWEDVSKCPSFGEGGAEIKRVALHSKEPFRTIKTFPGGDWVVFSAEVEAKKDIASPIMGLVMNNEYGQPIIGVGNWMVGAELDSLTAGQTVVVDFEMKLPLLKNGQYAFTVSIAEGTEGVHIQHHWVHDAYVLEIVNNNPQCAQFYVGLGQEEVNITVRD